MPSSSAVFSAMIATPKQTLAPMNHSAGRLRHGIAGADRRTRWAVWVTMAETTNPTMLAM